MTRVLITGGLGFQGQHLARALRARGDDVIVLDTPSERKLLAAAALGCPVVWSSVLATPLLVQIARERDVIVHLAAVTNPDKAQAEPAQAVRTNVAGTQSVLEAARVSKTRLIVTSSCEVYGGPLHVMHVQDEYAPFRPPHVYGASKAAADVLARAYTPLLDASLTILRPCNIFGPGQKAGEHGAVIPTMTAHALAGRPIVVRGGQQRREFLYIDDMIAAYCAVIDDQRPGVYNVGGDMRVSIRQIADRIAATLLTLRGSVDIIIAPPRAAEPLDFNLDSSLFRSVYTDWSPRVAFDHGLTRYIAWAMEQT